MVNMECMKRRQYTVTRYNDTSESTPISQGTITCEVRKLSNLSPEKRICLYVSNSEKDNGKATDQYVISMTVKEFRTLYQEMTAVLHALTKE